MDTGIAILILQIAIVALQAILTYLQSRMIKQLVAMEQRLLM